MSKIIVVFGHTGVVLFLGRQEVEADVIAFAENPGALDFDDGDDEIFPRGVQLEIRLAQSFMFLGHTATWECLIVGEYESQKRCWSNAGRFVALMFYGIPDFVANLLWKNCSQTGTKKWKRRNSFDRNLTDDKYGIHFCFSFLDSIGRAFGGVSSAFPEVKCRNSRPSVNKLKRHTHTHFSIQKDTF